jgi:integrase
MGYATRTRRPPRTLTEAEQLRILKITGRDRDGFRDHVILSLALGCGLRESEIVGLDVDDVTADGRTPRRSLKLPVFKNGGGKADEDAQRVTLPDGTFYKLEKYLKGLPRGYAGPLFPSRQSARLSVRRVRSMFRTWQKRAGFDQLYPFHALRHSAVTNIYRETRDVRVAQRFARHANVQTTTIYAHVSDEDMARATKKLAS